MPRLDRRLIHPPKATTMTSWKPQLLPKDNPDLDTLPYPVFVSPKLDGIRCIITDKGPMTRSLKPIPNRDIFRKLARKSLVGLDGEIIHRSLTHPQVFNLTTRLVRNHDRVSDNWIFIAFDVHSTNGLRFSDRVVKLASMVQDNPIVPQLGYVDQLFQRYAYNAAEVLALEEEFLDKGYEGIVIRNMEGLYKQGRCTLREANGWKLKRWSDHEAEVLDMIPLQHNANEAFTNELGQQKRSKAKAGLVEMQTMGKLLVKDIETGKVFKIGSGFTQKDRDWWFNEGESGLVITYKKFAHGEVKAPRMPIYKGLRMKEDIS